MKHIVVLGSTGKIGKAVLEIVRAYKNEFKIIGLSTNKNKDLLREQIQEFKPLAVGVGEKDLVTLASMQQADMVVVGEYGYGHQPTHADGKFVMLQCPKCNHMETRDDMIQLEKGD